MAFADFRAADAIAVRTSAKLLHGPPDLALPAPCAGWNLADLLAQMTVQHLGFAAAARGEAWPLERWRPGPLGAAAAEGVIAAFDAVDALDAPMSIRWIARPQSCAAGANGASASTGGIT
ncbi:hypothetical protein [Dactylosporangium sp. NPDC051484]|uniref:hypothetical protein n=1 Tax=Dactylosporangium sp. NPDC051484 TaxID=3154942 RepID=UPI00344FD80E